MGNCLLWDYFGLWWGVSGMWWRYSRILLRLLCLIILVVFCSYLVVKISYRLLVLDVIIWVNVSCIGIEDSKWFLKICVIWLVGFKIWWGCILLLLCVVVSLWSIEVEIVLELCSDVLIWVFLVKYIFFIYVVFLFIIFYIFFVIFWLIFYLYVLFFGKRYMFNFMKLWWVGILVILFCFVNYICFVRIFVFG